MKNRNLIFNKVPNMSDFRLSPEERDYLYNEQNIDKNHPIYGDDMVDARKYRV